MSNYLEGKVMDYVLKGTAFSAPAGRYLALFTSDPGEAGGGVEVSGGAYARQPIAFNAFSAGSSVNTSDVTFPVATASWGNITHAAIYDAVTAGNLLFSGALGTAQTVNINNQLVFKAGQVIATLD
jgi:hypothetical protein